MPKPIQPDDPGSIWRNQPEEAFNVSLERIVKRRTEELGSRTRAEIITSIAAALLLVAVVGYRIGVIGGSGSFGYGGDRLVQLGLAAVIAWVAITLLWFRRRIWPDPARPDTAAATGLEYYRRELERRRDHLRNGWLWHGPLFLALLILAAILSERAFRGFQPLRNIAPLALLLAAWTGFRVWRRRLQARNVQLEIEEIDPRRAPAP